MEVLTREAFLHTDFDGSGYGYGTGYGYGIVIGAHCGPGLKSINGQPVDMIDDVPTILTSIIGNAAKGFIVRHDFSLAPGGQAGKQKPRRIVDGNHAHGQRQPCNTAPAEKQQAFHQQHRIFDPARHKVIQPQRQRHKTE